MMPMLIVTVCFLCITTQRCFPGINFVPSSSAEQSTILDAQAALPHHHSPQDTSPIVDEPPLTQLDSDILQHLIEDKLIEKPQQNDGTTLPDSSFLNENTAFDSSNVQSTGISLGEKMESENLIRDENICTSQAHSSQRFAAEDFGNSHGVIGSSEYGNSNWNQNYANQSEAPKTGLFDQAQPTTCDNLTSRSETEQALYHTAAEETDATAETNYQRVVQPTCIQQQAFRQESCASEARASFSHAGPNQHFSVSFSDPANVGEQVSAYKQPCSTELIQSQVNSSLPIPPHLASSQTMLSPDDAYQQVTFSAPNLPNSLGYNSSDTCLAPGKLATGTTTQLHPGHGYHGNGDFGSSSGYETQSNTSASPYTSPDSIASLQQGASDVTTCTSASNSQMDMQFSSQVQTSLCSGGQRLPSYSQPPQSTIYSAPSTDSGKNLVFSSDK